MKHDTLDQYLALDTDLPQRALLTVWDCLAAYREELVLVGGLAIRQLTKPPSDGGAGPVTLDVDFGIHIAAESGMYGSIRETLSGHGFVWKEQRFTRQFSEIDLHIDLLTDDGQSDGGTTSVDNGLAVSIVPGINRALEKCRLIAVTGKTLLGVTQTEEVRVADVGPMLVPKGSEGCP